MIDPPSAQGLSEDEAAARLSRDGPNELPRERPRGIGPIALDVIREPMFVLLVGCGLVYLLLGEPGEAALLLSAVVVVVGITFAQKHRTQRALEALRDLSSPRALVIRNGRRRRVAGREVANGDWVVLSEGDRVPADGVVLHASHLYLDESLLTGESEPVAKHSDPGAALSAPATGGGACVYSASLVTSGSGVFRVEAIGIHTAVGRIGRALTDITDMPTRLQRETTRVVRRVALAALSLSVIVAVIMGAVRGQWLEGLLAGLALAMALLPEEFPVVLSVFLALGAWRIARRQVLTRRSAAIEALGAATVLCVDKTGTLTENRMSVRRLITDQGIDVEVGSQPLPESAHRLVEFAILATRSDPFDPMERAINALGLGDLVDAEHLHADWLMAREYPLAPRLPAMSQVWQARRGGTRCVAAKGAPEAIVDLCHLGPADADRVLRQARSLAADGLRVLGVACARLTHDRVDVSASAAMLPAAQHDFAFEFLGLIGLSDPLRAGVTQAVAECHTAGIRVLMITGDHRETACHVARQAGIAVSASVLGGNDIDTLDDEGLRHALADCNLIARARPEHKLRIVRALQHSGEVVAMTGDGVNDAPALRAADIGIAMGGRGTDVAREAAHLIVADDDFSSIVHAIRLGRRIFDNLRHAIGYIIAVHLPIAGLSLLPVLMGWPLILLPAHIAFLELIIDPACSLAFEAEPGNAAAMRRPPRPLSEPLFNRRTLLASMIQGSLVLLLALAGIAAGHRLGWDDSLLRSAAFSLLVLGNLALLVSNRSHSRDTVTMLGMRNWPMWGVIAGTLAALGLVLFVPAASALFRLQTPPPAMLGVWLLAAVLTLVLAGAINRRLHQQPATPPAGQAGPA